jgi:hypothetical protein
MPGAQSSRETPRGAPLSHHRAYGSRTTAVSDNVQRHRRQDSFLIPYRKRSWLLARRGSGSAFPSDAVARRVPRGFVQKPPWSNTALLPLHAHRMVQAAPWLSNSALRPVARTTMASADFSLPVRGRCQPPAPANRRGREISQGKTLILPSIAAGFTCVVSVWLSGFPIRRRVTPPHRPCIRFLFVSSEFCLKASSPPHLAVTQLPSANGSGHPARRGLAPPRSLPCLAHDVDTGLRRHDGGAAPMGQSLGPSV